MRGAALRKFIVFEGTHGDIHRLYPVDVGNRDAIPRQGGVLAITNEDGAPLYIGDATSIFDFLVASDVWRRAKQQFGGKHVYFLSTGIAPWRASGAKSLREHLHPPMN